MEFLYALINVAILVAILVVFGKKAITGIFNVRAVKINKALDEAESPVELSPLPEFSPLPEGPSRAVLAIQESRDEDLAKLGRQFNRQVQVMEREAILSVREALIESLMQKATERMSSEAYRSELRNFLPAAAEKIISAITLTSGDMSYLSRSDSLYVTLSSAEELPDALIERIHQAADELLRGVNSQMSFRVDVQPDLLGGLRLRIGDTIYDNTIKNSLYRLKQQLVDLACTEAKEDVLLESLQAAVERVPKDIDIFQVGRVLSVSDGICWLDGVADIMLGELVEFETGEHGMVLEIQETKVGCIIFGRYEHIETYSRVRRLNIMASVPVGEELLGRVVDALGNPIDGKGKILTSSRRNIECNAPAIPDRLSVSVPLHTGIKAIDSLVPIGRGQRELIIGDRQTGKTALAVDTILSQKGENVRCIYVAVGQKNATVAEIAERLEAEGALEYTTIISATAADSASLQYIAPFAGAAMAEHFMYAGQDALVIYDDLSKHAVAYRELSLLLQRPSGREAYPGDIFYLHSRLLERSARLNEQAGGGSVTALPIVETQAGDISAYIPTNVISITDGQIFLETDLFNEGQRPAVNAGLSVSRVGGAAQTKLMKQLSASLRTGLAQYRELAAFTQLGSELDDATQKTLAAGDRMMAALRQGRYAPLALWQETVLLFAVSKGYADHVDASAIPDYEQALYSWFCSEQPELVKKLQSGSKLDAQAEEALRAALSAFNEER